MSVAPAARLVGAAAAWSAAAVAVVLWPALWIAHAAALAVLAVLVVWDAALLARRPPITAERRLPPRAFVGRDAELTLALHNPGAEAVEVEVIDELPSDLAPTEPRLAGVRVAGGAALLLRQVVLPTLRGDRLLGPVLLLERSPLGLLRRRGRAAAGAVLRVYPDASRFLRPEALDPRRVLAALGARPARRRGTGMEFESLRDYVVGDDPRRVDWAATARRGRLVTRLYQHERNHTVLIALDASRLMGGAIAGRTKLDHAIDAALALTFAALGAGDRVGMLVFDRTVRGTLAPRAHRRHLGLFVELLRTAHTESVEPDYRAFARSIAVRQRALVVVFTDFVEADPVMLIEPLAVLARRHRLLLVALRDPAYGRLAPDAPAVEEPLDLYRRLVVDELLRERETTLGRLRRAGLQTLDLVPEAVTAAVLNRYLALRDAGDR